MKLKAVRGFKDWLPEEFVRNEYLINKARGTLKKFNYKEVKLPILEKTELFVRSIGEVTDIVQKETYSFEDRNKDWVTLRPEATAGICRAIIEHGLHTRTKPLKFFTVGPMFRHERPQKGRLREFFQVDAELFCELNPYLEAEVIRLALDILNQPFESGEPGFRVEVNSLGCRECRKVYREKLLDYLRQREGELCEVCKQRIERNPLRVLDCKEEKCKEVVKEAPVISDYFCSACAEHFELLKKALKEFGVGFVVNPRLVRGLDYYTRTTFEIKAKELGAQDTVCAGGRYDYLLKELGGPMLPAIGFAIGLERWAIVFAEREKTLCEKLEKSLLPDVFVAVMDEENFGFAGNLARELRKSGLRVEIVYEKKGLKGLLKTADKLGARYTVIIGENEVKEKALLLRNMTTGNQERVEFEELEDLTSKLKERIVCR